MDKPSFHLLEIMFWGLFTPHSHPAKYKLSIYFPNRPGSICKCHSAAVGETYSI